MKHEPIITIALATLVDELAALKASVAPIEERMESIKDQLKSHGLKIIQPGEKSSRIDGAEHTAVITVTEPETLDRDRLRSDLGEAIWLSYLKPSKAVVTCKVTARKTR